MAGTANIRTAPVSSIVSANFDSNGVPADDSNTLSGDMPNGFPNTAAFIIFSSGFASNADQLVGTGSVVIGNTLAVVTSNDTVKGPFHSSTIFNCVGPVTGNVALYAEDGTNGGYYDFTGYKGGWKQLIASQSDTPDAGSALSLTATVSHVGAYVNSSVGGESMFELVATAISWCGREISVDGGTVTAGNEITFAAISLSDRSTTRSAIAPFTGNFYGHAVDVSGIISLRGPIQLGDAASTNNTYMLEVNKFCLWDDAPVHTKFYRIDITKNGASSTTTVIWGDSATPSPVTIDVAGTVLRWALFTAGAAADEPTEFSVYGCTLKRGRAWELGSTTTIDGGVLQDITDITMNASAEILNAQMIDVKVIYALPPVTTLTGSTFSSPSTYCMTISTQTANMTVDYEFDATCRGAGKAIEFTHASGNILITAATGYYQPVLADVTVSGAGTVSFPAAGVVTVKVTAVENDGTPIQSARVHLRASDGTGPLPFEEVVTITRAGTVASVNHVGHGMANGDKILLAGITDKIEDNAVQTISNVTVNDYDYTTTNSGSTLYLGLINSTFVALEGLTDVNGELSTSRLYSLPQPVTGWTRKSTSAPYFKQGILTGGISDTDGYNSTAVMISDE